MRWRALLFFAVSGAHGAGKTTLPDSCGALFDCWGDPVRRFDQIVGFVPNEAAQ